MPFGAVELAELVIASLFVAIGVTAVAAALSARPRANRAAGWFGLFCVMYGVRMLANAALVRAVTNWPERFFEHVDAFITYTILVPATLFVEALVGGDRRAILRRTRQLLVVCAIGAVVTDVVARRPYAAMALNSPLVVIAVTVWFSHLAAFAGRGRWSPEVRGVIGASALLAGSAIYETVMGHGLLDPIDVEPIAMLVFSGALGWLVLVRARDQETNYAALSRELELARSIQQSLLPRSMPDVPGLRFAGSYLPMSAVAGDIYEILPLRSGRMLVVVADVSGHGVPAALIASMVKIAVAAEADRYDTPGEILTGINRALTGKFESAYITACCAVFDPQRDVVCYALAGHPPPFLRRADGRIEPLDCGGTVLAFMPSSVYQTSEVSFEVGDRLLVYTDGLTEARRANDEEFFGDAELARVLASIRASDDLMASVLDAHRRWIGPDAALSDDVSLVVVERI